MLWFFQQCGFEVHDPLALTFDELVASPFKDQFRPVEVCDFGDVVHFGGLGEHHIGIATFGGVLQATKDRGVVVLPWWSAFQQSPLLGAYRLKALGVLGC